MVLRKYLLFLFFILTTFLPLPRLSLYAQSLSPITINNNSKYTNASDGSVELRLFMQRATQMFISNHPNFSEGEWEDYVTFRKWLLSGEDGLKTVYIKFKDQSGKESNSFSASINLDRTPPEDPEVLMDKNEKYTTNFLRQVQLSLQVKEGDFMMIAGDSTFQGGRWIEFTKTMNYTLYGNEGEKWVYAKFKDKAGNESKIVKDNIILDLVPPSLVSLQINNGDKLTNDEKVKITIVAKDAAEILLKEPDAKWQTFRSEIEDFHLAGEDGLKTVSLKLKDEAGNVSNPFSAQIKLDRSAPKESKIIIDNNQPFTTEPSGKVVLRLYAEEAIALMVSEDSGFTGLNWENYKTIINWILSEGDGKKKVYARFKDHSGNVSKPVYDEIVLDRSSPEVDGLIINQGNKVTNKIQVTLQLKSSEARQMMVGSNEAFLGAMWEKYIPEKKMTLQGRDGEKWFFVKYKDAAGNISMPARASIILDRLPPTETKLTINKGIGYSTHPESKVTLALTAEGASEMLISNTKDFKGTTWQPFKESIEWKLPGEDGLKIVGVRFRDGAGNVSRVVTDRVKLARSATVKGKFDINSDSLLTKNPYRKVDLNITGEGAKEMMISNSEDFKKAVWEEFSTHKIWTLSDGDGEKTVYLKLKGYVGNESKIYSDKIIMDRSAPKNGKLAINNESLFTVNQKNEVTLSIHAANATKMMISNNPVFYGASWEPYKTSKIWVLEKDEGVKNVYIKFKDDIGNESEVTSDRILLDKTAPQNVGLKINNGSEFTNNERKAVTLVFAAEGAVKMRISNLPDIESSPWEKISNKKLNWILPGEDGEKRVYVQYKDEGENESAVVFDKITLDRKPPKNCSFTINNDSLYTNNLEADVRLYISGEEVASFLISNRRDFFGARWERFKTYKSHWILDGEDGEKAVYMLFKDEAGNLYPDTLEHKIILDRTPPSEISVSIKGEKADRNVRLHLKAKDAEMMEIRSSKDIEGKWEHFVESKDWTLGEGEETNIWVRFRDKAGNTSDFYSVFQNQ